MFRDCEMCEDNPASWVVGFSFGDVDCVCDGCLRYGDSERIWNMLPRRAITETRFA